MAGTERTSRQGSTARRTPDRQQKTVPVTGRKPRKINEGGMPPVMARNPTVPRPANLRKPQHKVKRRFDVSMNTRGLEMRLPAVPQFGVGWRAASFILAGLLIFGLYQVFTMPVFKVQSLEINGLYRVSSQQVYEALNLSNTPVFMLDSQEIANSLMQEFPEFSQAQAAVSLPNSVVITVTERTPVLIWQTPGVSYLVDYEGMPFPLRESMQTGSLPIVQAEELEIARTVPEITAETLSIVEQILGYIPAELNVETKDKRLISKEMAAAVLLLNQATPEGATLIYSKEHGLGWQDRRGWPVYFGRPQDIEMKFQVYKYLWEQIKAEEGRPSLISVEYIHAPYYRLGQQ